jgi:hypothetical protein
MPKSYWSAAEPFPAPLRNRFATSLGAILAASQPFALSVTRCTLCRSVEGAPLSGRGGPLRQRTRRVRCARWQILKVREVERDANTRKRGAVLTHLLFRRRLEMSHHLLPHPAYTGKKQLARGVANPGAHNTKQHIHKHERHCNTNIRAVAVGSGKNTWVGGRWEMVRDTWESVVPPVYNLHPTLCDGDWGDEYDAKDIKWRKGPAIPYEQQSAGAGATAKTVPRKVSCKVSHQPCKMGILQFFKKTNKNPSQALVQASSPQGAAAMDRSLPLLYFADLLTFICFTLSLPPLPRHHHLLFFFIIIVPSAKAKPPPPRRKINHSPERAYVCLQVSLCFSSAAPLRGI